MKWKRKMKNGVRRYHSDGSHGVVCANVIDKGEGWYLAVVSIKGIGIRGARFLRSVGEGKAFIEGVLQYEGYEKAK